MYGCACWQPPAYHFSRPSQQHHPNRLCQRSLQFLPVALRFPRFWPFSKPVWLSFALALPCVWHLPRHPVSVFPPHHLTFSHARLAVIFPLLLPFACSLPFSSKSSLALLLISPFHSPQPLFSA